MGRTCFLVGVAVFAAIASWLAAAGRLRDVAWLGVPVMEPSFADVRSITGASLALDRGIDPMVDNLGDPWHRPFNYPRVWLLPAELGVGPEHTAIVAGAVWLVFAFGIATLLPLATTTLASVVLLLLLFAPATWLAMERANNDLAIFGLLAVAAWLANQWQRTSAALVVAAAALKLFPIFAVAGLCTDDKRARRAIVAITLLFFGYLVWIRDDLPLIRANAQTWHPISYGITLLPRAVADRLDWSFGWLLGFAIVVFAAVVVLATVARRRVRLGAAGSAHSLAAFRIGASVFVGTFCLGSNFDYRLVVLLLVAPQLVVWTRTTIGRVRVAIGTLLTVLILVAWSMTWRAALTNAIGATTVGLVVDEVATWCLACGLAFVLVLTLPDWSMPASRRDQLSLDDHHPDGHCLDRIR